MNFTDNEFQRLMKSKKIFSKEQNSHLTWHKFIVLKCCKGVSVKRAERGLRK